MKINKIILTLMSLLIFNAIAFSANVDNYFTRPDSTGDNILVVGGTQNVSGTLNVTGTLNASSGTVAVGLITASSATITNTITGGTITDGTASLTSGALSAVTTINCSTVTLQNSLILANPIAGQFNIYDADENSLLQITDAGTTGNADVSGTLNATQTCTFGSGDYTTTIGGGGLLINSFELMADSGTVTISSGTVIIASKAGAMEITLPDAATSDGKIFTIKKTDADASIVSLNAVGGTIDGADPYNEIDAQYDFVTIISDGTNWHIIGKWIS